MVLGVTLVPTERHIGLPQEVLFQILSYLDVQALGRVACVSKALLTASEDDHLWEAHYVRAWKKPTEWIGSPPSRWKDHFLTVAKVCRFAQRAPQQESLIFWSFGLPDESARSSTPSPLLDLQQKCVAAAMGNIPTILTIDTPVIPIKEENPDRDKIFNMVFLILRRVRSSDTGMVRSAFFTHRYQIRNYSRLLEWWLSQIIAPSLPREDHHSLLSFPLNPEKKEVSDFLQGFFLIWLQYGEDKTHFHTLRALRKISCEIESVDNHSFLEELIIRILARKGSFCHLEYLANLYLHFSPFILPPFPKNSCSDPEPLKRRPPNQDELEKTQRLYLQIIGLYGKEPIPLRIASNLSQTLMQLKSLNSLNSLQIRALRLPILIFRSAVIQQNVKIAITDFDTILQFAVAFRRRVDYPFLGACLQRIRLPYDEKRRQLMTSFECQGMRIEDFDLITQCTAIFQKTPDGRCIQARRQLFRLPTEDKTVELIASFHNAQIQFYLQTKNFVEALYSWMDLCWLLEQRLDCKDPDLFKNLYSILDSNLQVREEMILVQSDIANIQLAIAYAYHRLNRQEELLKTLRKISGYFDLKKFPWLAKEIETDFRAAELYASSLNTYEEVEKHYFTMLKLHPQKKALIYHNLATNVYFLPTPTVDSDDEGDTEDVVVANFNKALDFARTAWQENPKVPETHILIGLCHRLRGEKNLAASSMQMGLQLAQGKFPANHAFSKKDLLIFSS